MCARSRASLSSHPGPQLTQAPAASRALEWWRPGHFTASPLRLILGARCAESGGPQAPRTASSAQTLRGTGGRWTFEDRGGEDAFQGLERKARSFA